MKFNSALPLILIHRHYFYYGLSVSRSQELKFIVQFQFLRFHAYTGTYFWETCLILVLHRYVDDKMKSCHRYFWISYKIYCKIQLQSFLEFSASLELIVSYQDPFHQFVLFRYRTASKLIHRVGAWDLFIEVG